MDCGVFLGPGSFPGWRGDKRSSTVHPRLRQHGAQPNTLDNERAMVVRACELNHCRYRKLTIRVVRWRALATSHLSARQKRARDGSHGVSAVKMTRSVTSIRCSLKTQSNAPKTELHDFACSFVEVALGCVHRAVRWRKWTCRPHGHQKADSPARTDQPPEKCKLTNAQLPDTRTSNRSVDNCVLAVSRLE